MSDTFNIAMSADWNEHNSNVPMCQEKDCQNPAIQCTIPNGIDNDGKEYDESYEYYCSEHARDAGFCCCCGTFIAGWRDFSDLCENCEDETTSND